MKLAIGDLMVRVIQAMYVNCYLSLLRWYCFSEFQIGCPYELLLADDLFIVAETINGLLAKLYNEGLQVNMDKT